MNFLTFTKTIHLVSLNFESAFHLVRYFAQSGLKTQLNTLNSAYLWGVTLAITLICCAVKFLPVMLVARVCNNKAVAWGWGGVGLYFILCG